MSPAAPTPLLDGITVLDFTRVLAGPYCTRLLADLGARVIKIERPGEGDDTRRGYTQLEEGRTDQATYFVRVNAGKLGVALDLAHPRGRQVALDLARDHQDLLRHHHVLEPVRRGLHVLVDLLEARDHVAFGAAIEAVGGADRGFVEAPEDGAAQDDPGELLDEGEPLDERDGRVPHLLSHRHHLTTLSRR